MSEMVPTRNSYGEELVEIGKTNEKVIVLSADLEDATRAEYFRDAFPKRFFTVGIAEQDMVGMAAGLSLQGFIPFVNSFAVFLTNRAYDMLRMDICYNNCNVKVVCSHAGLTVGEDGASAQCLEDFAIMRVLPNMKVICPVDAVETRKATRKLAEETGPVYMRTGRAPFPVLTKNSDPFEIGRANVMLDGRDVTLIACGLMVHESLQAAKLLEEEKISARVINMHTIKPVDQDEIVKAAAETGAIVTAEEHQVNAGLGGAVAEVLCKTNPVPLEMVAVSDTFGETGSPQELLSAYHLKDVDIVAAVKRVLQRKKT